MAKRTLSVETHELSAGGRFVFIWSSPSACCLLRRYKLRVLDAFGTEAIYNDDQYVKSHPELEFKAGWGRLGLRLKQFYTLYRMYSPLSFLPFSILYFVR